MGSNAINLNLVRWKRLKPVEVVEEFEKHTKSELNLLLEAAHCAHLGEILKIKNY